MRRHLCKVLQEIRICCAFIWRKSIPDRENGKCKSLEAGISLESLMQTGRPVWAEQVQDETSWRTDQSSKRGSEQFISGVVGGCIDFGVYCGQEDIYWRIQERKVL